MAITATKNPAFYSGPQLELEKTLQAVDSQTWQAGDPCYLTTTGKAKPLATGIGRIYGFFADSRASASSSTVPPIYRIVSEETKFVGHTSNGANDTTSQRTHKGENAGLRVTSVNSKNVTTVDVGNDTAGGVVLDDPIWVKEGFKNTSTDSPGRIIFHFKDTMLQG